MTTRIPHYHSRSMATLLLSVLLTIIISSSVIIRTVSASQRSIRLNPDGRYSGIVVGFSGDFVAPANQNDMISRLMANLQSTSNILNELIGYQLGEVTIVLQDGWTVDMSKLNGAGNGNGGNVTEAPAFLTAAESDVLFTDDESQQILTMQWGECGEPAAAPINFPKTFMSDQIIMPRLLAHQWLLYRYGVFNEFGYVSDDSYPVYFAPPNGGALNGSSASNAVSITSCSNRPEFNYTSQCGSQTVDPNTGLPNDRSCDVVPIEGSIASSFLYAPLVVSEYRLCDQKTHDFVSPNRQNALCDYQSAQTVISKHADFDIFKHQLSAKKPAAAPQPIHFRIWQQKNGNSNPLVNSKANLFYAFPAGYAYYKHLLSGDREISGYLPKSVHLVKACFFTETDLKFNDANDWKPSTQLLYPTVQKEPIKGKVQLNTVLRKIVGQFSQKEGVKMAGTVFFLFSGKHDVEAKDVEEQEVEQLAELFNGAGVGLRVVIVERMPSQAVLRFFDRLNARLTASQTSSVHYALSESELTSPSSPIASQVFSTVSSLLWDTVQELTEGAQISLKRQTFTLPSTLNFTIDQSFKGLPSSNGYAVLVEAFTSGASNSLTFTLSDQEGKHFTPKTSDTANDHLRTTLYGGDFKPGFYRLEVKSADGAGGSLVTVSIRVLAETNAYRSYAKEAPILGRCWLATDTGSDARYPPRGYVHLSKGLNGPVYEADVSLIVRRFDVASAHQEFHLPLVDNGRASPDITARDGVYSAYLDSVLGGGSSGPAAYSVMARVYSDKAALKPGNFGNTVMFKNRPRCCGADLGLKGDDQEVTGGAFERLINCGSFYSTGAPGTGGAQAAPFAIRDLRLVGIDAENRTVTLQWSSPFVASSTASSSSSSTSKFPPEVKAFHSYTQHTQLPAEIKEHWATLPAAESEIVAPQQPATATNTFASLSSVDSVLSSNTHYSDGHGSSGGNLPQNGNQQINSGSHPYGDQSEHLNTIFEMAPYEQTISMMSGGGGGGGSSGSGSSQSSLMLGGSSSVRTVTLRILSAEEGYYFVAVAEHADDGRKTRPSNVLPVYMKSNVPLENTTALAIDDEEEQSRLLPEGTRRDLLRAGPLEWFHILLIVIGVIVLIFLIVLIAFAYKIRRSRHQKNKSAAASSSPSSHIDYEVTKKSSSSSALEHGLTTSDGGSSGGKPEGGNGNSSVKSTYGGYSSNSNSHHHHHHHHNNQDDGSLLSSSLHNGTDRHSTATTNGGHHPHHHSHHQHLHHPPSADSNMSNNTSCSSVNTVDQTVGIPPAADYLTAAASHHLDHPHHHQHRPQPPLPERTGGGGQSQSMLRELNLAQLLPNSYDSNYLLDQYNRVMDAKQKRTDGGQQSHPHHHPHHPHHQQQRSQEADSPSIPSFGSSLENYNGTSGGTQQYNPYHQQHQQQYSHPQNQAYGGLVEGSGGDGHHHHQVMQVDSVDHPHHQQQQPHLYAPYSNVNSIFSSPQQQQQQYQHNPNQRSFSQQQQQQTGGSSLHHVTPAFTGYDDNGLPEYSVVRKSGLHHPNISQV